MVFESFRPGESGECNSVSCGVGELLSRLGCLDKQLDGRFGTSGKEGLAEEAAKIVLGQLTRFLKRALYDGTPVELPVLIALDGRAAAGKSTLANELGILLSAPVFHMDDFYLTPDLKTAERLAEAGGNVDRERFLSDVLVKLRQGGAFSYRPLIPHEWIMGEARRVERCDLAIVEGAYTLHPSLRSFYLPELSFFVDVQPEEQMRRIEMRNGSEAAHMFRDRWIPLEEHYIEATAVADYCSTIIRPGRA